jgi:gluconate 5-dehydrogenase
MSPTNSAGDPAVPQLFDLRGRVALVTGATGRLGSAMARALAEAGASVIASSRRLDDACAVAGELPAVAGAGQAHRGVAIDYTSEKSVRDGFAAAAAAGAVDVLVNNGHEPLAADWATVTRAQFERQVSLAAGYFELARLTRDHAVARGAPATIVMIASMYGLVGSYPDAYAGIGPASPVAYHALKGGVIQMTRHLAVYWAADRVRVNCLSPGPFPPDTAPPELLRRLRAKTPLDRIGQPHELKGAIVFLASDASSYMTGHNLVIDGGWTAW